MADEDTITVELAIGDVLLIDAMLNAAIDSLPEGDETLLHIIALLGRIEWAMHEQKGVRLQGDPR